MEQKPLSYGQKLKQAHREAKATVVAVAFVVIAWCVLGFGLSGLDIQVFHTPLWVVGGTIGIWLVAVAVAVFLTRRVFVDFSFDDEEGEAAHD